ncbi:MAG: NlpC/P60 family protein [Pseudomonadota bacterium]
MTDPRRLPSNGVYAAAELTGQVKAEHFVDGEICRVSRPVVDLRLRQDIGPLDRQLLYGDRFRVLERVNGLAFGQSDRGDYVGYVAETALAEWLEPNSRVIVRASLGFQATDLKAPGPVRLPMGARVAVHAHDTRWAETACGLFIPLAHLAPLDDPAPDPVAVAEAFLGTPYLWGGNSDLGIDCSGLVQIACLACGIDCPGDSDQQQEELGAALARRSQLRRRDLMFWRGHVAWVVDESTLLHANAHHMAVAYEPLEEAVARIEAQGDGPVTARKRLERTP